jgi:hypothetical protein
MIDLPNGNLIIRTSSVWILWKRKNNAYRKEDMEK